MVPTTTYSGSAPSVFIGSFRYPNVQVGPLMTDDLDLPTEWIMRGLTIEDIVQIRAQTLRGITPQSRFISDLQELSLSRTPLTVDVSFEKAVVPDVLFDGTVSPIGLSAPIQKMEVTDNAKVDRVVDRVTSDSDMRATDGCLLLHDRGIDVYRITRLLSMGLLGQKRHIVPTRWAITATDDMIFSGLKQEFLNCTHIDGIRLFSATLYGNKIVCLFFPGDWRYEMIEVWGPQSLWGGLKGTIATDRERKRKASYSPITGAYYSARLAVAEYLAKNDRTASVLIVRSISSAYWAPLGTWVIREATRHALSTQPRTFDTIDDAVAAASTEVGFSSWVNSSQLIPYLRTQKTLSYFSV